MASRPPRPRLPDGRDPACATDCTFDTSGARRPAATTPEPGEEVTRPVPGQQQRLDDTDCADYGQGTGTVSCNSDCTSTSQRACEHPSMTAAARASSSPERGAAAFDPMTPNHVLPSPGPTALVSRWHRRARHGSSPRNPTRGCLTPAGQLPRRQGRLGPPCPRRLTATPATPVAARRLLPRRCRQPPVSHRPSAPGTVDFDDRALFRETPVFDQFRQAPGLAIFRDPAP